MGNIWGSVVIWISTLAGAFAQSNIVYNAGFEITEPIIYNGWSVNVPVGGWISGRGAHGGKNFISIGVHTPYLRIDDPVDAMNPLPITVPGDPVVGQHWQDLNTVPGRDYVLSLWVRGSEAPLKVRWGDVLVADLSVNAQGWSKLEYNVTAVSEATRLLFDCPGVRVWMDDVSVVWAREPPSIIAHPKGRSAPEGGKVGFRVRADGYPELAYQWHLDGQPLDGETKALLYLTELQTADAGGYTVTVTNPFGSVTSAGAGLQVEMLPTSPTIVSHPHSRTIARGYRTAVQVVARGQGTLSYEWRKDGEPIHAETESVIAIDTTALSARTEFEVTVRNAHGSARSLKAVINVIDPVSGGGEVLFTNLDREALLSGFEHSQIRDLDGTPLEGEQYLAQLYASPNGVVYHAVGDTAPFSTGFGGFVVPTENFRTLPDIPAGRVAYLQIRAWEASAGPTYESARANGGKHGKSIPYRSTTGGYIDGGPLHMPAAYPWGMVGFKLEAGLPLFSTGRLAVKGSAGGGVPEWSFEGETGFRYLIEKRIPPNDWGPHKVVTNTTGTVTFTDDQAVGFYRTRILD